MGHGFLIKEVALRSGIMLILVGVLIIAMSDKSRVNPAGVAIIVGGMFDITIGIIGHFFGLQIMIMAAIMLGIGYILIALLYLFCWMISYGKKRG